MTIISEIIVNVSSFAGVLCLFAAVGDNIFILTFDENREIEGNSVFLLKAAVINVNFSRSTERRNVAAL